MHSPMTVTVDAGDWHDYESGMTSSVRHDRYGTHAQDLGSTFIVDDGDSWSIS
jgi:hypothetical protein